MRVALRENYLAYSDILKVVNKSETESQLQWKIKKCLEWRTIFQTHPEGLHWIIKQKEARTDGRTNRGIFMEMTIALWLIGDYWLGHWLMAWLID